MTVWLVENEDIAHAYPDDETDAVAACGYRLEGSCGHCGHELRIRNGRKGDLICATCATAIAGGDLK